MVENEIITLNEVKNDGSIINLYFNDITGFWMSFGLSAFGLRLFGKSNGFNTIRCFSQTMQMPCTIVANDVISELMSVGVTSGHPTEVNFSVKMPDTVDKDTYAVWVAKLRDKGPAEGPIVVTTFVSKFLPRDQFIPDGMSSFARNGKRLFDGFIAMICLIVFSPLFLFTWIAVRREDGGPAIYKQERIGRFGRPFYIYKFRSMRLDAEKMGPQLSHSGGDDDPRLTKIGKFIRAHHLDELPQLWNVFCGDMSFIGPRPERKFYIDQILEHDYRYTYLYQIRPGVTSYATLYNGYTDTMEKMLKRLEFDLYYLGHRSWWFDLKILFNTFFSIVFGKKF